MIVPRCTVRACGLSLRTEGPSLVCAGRHSFNRARQGYVNLLQPADKRSREPGDSKEVASARRRLLDAGFGRALLEGLVALLEPLQLAPGARALDVGCGEGSFLGALALRFGLEAAGVDLSRAALALAARRHPELTWLAANADRALPFADRSFELVLSVDARRNPAECARVLVPGGALVVAVPAPEDQAELREAALGTAFARDRSEQLLREHDACFELETRAEVRSRARYDAAELEDLLRATYRAGRAGRAQRAAALAGEELTSSHQLFLLRRRPAGAR